ncbi:MAG: RNA pyrophosphohydrolase [Acidimicrobiia bacterium]|nr:RNA pyrophosphohydrolase [Acidimicrobiia bacterium]MDH4307067.1 RNA pyrophosphohydrolase [Acidimicrobiia bacterium]MDH5292759.1 RNA pyrophosphohydrolase [Acidimicrobiia bacterium]
MGHGEWMRAGVGAVITGDDGRVLVFERCDVAGSWQFVQGGLDLGEEPLTGVLREIEEETGIGPAHLRLLGELPHWITYEFPPELRGGGCRGQTQRWFVFRFPSDTPIRLPDGDLAEFRDYKWTSMAEAVELVVDFKRPVYLRLASELDHVVTG